ncbi:hypothetical protein BN000_04747 [Mycobacterium europaeum]|uniref:Uncharacterized protein n=1 Tax=Mycobacterium europaeum TaxID=761804 RepID=A0A0U1DP13_9MYCO|nr:hypothetical protein BN000_04747 [Mycobacterium europaeum]
MARPALARRGSHGSTFRRCTHVSAGGSSTAYGHRSVAGRTRCLTGFVTQSVSACDPAIACGKLQSVPAVSPRVRAVIPYSANKAGVVTHNGVVMTTMAATAALVRPPTMSTPPMSASRAEFSGRPHRTAGSRRSRGIGTRQHNQPLGRIRRRDAPPAYGMRNMLPANLSDDGFVDAEGDSTDSVGDIVNVRRAADALLGHAAGFDSPLAG